MENISQLIGISSIIFSVACAVFAEKRGGSPLVWFFLGLIFGPIAFIIALTSGKQCPHCKSWLPSDAKICRYCAKELQESK